MKRIFILAIIFFSVFSSSLAISLNQLRNNPNLYQHVFSDNMEDEYIDKNTVTVVRYNPPYYTINATAYAVNYDTNTITKYDNTYFIDYNRSLSRLTAQYGNNKDTLIAQLVNNSGIQWRVSGLTIFNYDGSTKFAYTYLDPMEVKTIQNSKLGSPSFMAGMYVFYKAYNMYFNPPLKNQLF